MDEMNILPFMDAKLWMKCASFPSWMQSYAK